MLPAAVEDALAGRVMNQAFIRNGTVPQEFRGALKAVTRTLGLPFVGGSRGHARHFLHRHKDLSLRTGERTQANRAVGMTHGGFNRFSNNLEKVGIKDCPPHKLINIDESDAKSSKPNQHR